MVYYSQSKQDRLIDLLFDGKEGGFFLDIGAHDGITFSNSFFFEKERNWKGICIEANPKVFLNLQKNRNCITLNYCISHNERDDFFLCIDGYSEMLSGIVSEYDQRHLKRIETEVRQWRGECSKLPIKTKTIGSVLDEWGIVHIDYCSIDTEGSEYSILQTFDLSRITVNTFSIENNYDDNKIRAFLDRNNYSLMTKLGVDEIYVKNP